MGYAAAIDVGGGSAKVGIVHHAGHIVARDHVPTPAAGSPEDLAEAYARCIESLLKQCEHVDAVGIGVGLPGCLDQGRRMSTFSNVPILDGFPLAEFLERRFSLPVRADNDATLAALAEHRFGAGGASKRLMVVTLGTGIGLGMVRNDQPLQLTNAFMADAGHIVVDHNARYCCRHGCRGCLESVASSIALERDATALATRGASGRLVEVLKLKGRVDTSDVIQAGREGDTVAAGLIEDVGAWIGTAVASWCCLYNPDLILFGGGIATAGEPLLASIDRVMRNVGMPAYVAATQTGLARLGNDAGLIGAASLLLPAAWECTA